MPPPHTRYSASGSAAPADAPRCIAFCCGSVGTGATPCTTPAPPKAMSVPPATDGASVKPSAAATFSAVVVPGLVVKRSGVGEPCVSDRLPASLRLSPNTTTWLKLVAAAAVLNNRPATMAPARRLVRGIATLLGPELASLFARYVNARHTEAHAAAHRGRDGYCGRCVPLCCPARERRRGAAPAHRRSGSRQRPRADRDRQPCCWVPGAQRLNKQVDA